VSGYVRIHRSLIGHPAFRNDAEAMAFAWMVAKAQWQPKRVRYKGHDIWLDRGQLTVSIRDFAQAMERSKGWAERLLARLREHGMIAQKSGTQVGTQVGTHGGTVGGTPAAVITICNYDLFQPSGNDRETPDGTPDRTDAGHARDTEQVKEEREEEESEAIASVSPRQPISEAVSFYNTNAVHAGWPTIAKLSDKRRRSLGARLREHGLDGWKAAITRARASPYLGSDPPPWFNFDFLIHPTKFLKVIEGNYDKRHSADSPDPTLLALASFREAGPGV
jgi:hypothetical protein